MDEISGFLEFLNYGAAGVLALGFLLLVYLLWRRDDKSTKAINALSEKDDRLDSLLEVVTHNTAAMTCVKKAVEENSRVIEKLDTDFGRRLDELGRDVRELREKL